MKKILIANRGEIARRIMRTCRDMGIRTVAVYSEADRHELFVKEADEAICIGGYMPADSYLDQQKIIAAAQRSRAEAIHPGFGFLSENAGFAQRVESEGLIFIGPSPEAIEAMGSKSRSKEIVSAFEVPLIPGYQGKAQDDKTLAEEARKIGFPLLIKASAGGGGKGMRIVRQESELLPSILTARSEAESAFGDGTLLIEKYFDTARHIEVQILGDKHGNLLHFYERECSLQRRFQKIVEEAPSPTLTPAQRELICQTALAVGKSVGYYNAGTVEMLLAPDGQHYFLEMNTRLQVEHPVTEAITGVDLVRLQIEVAMGLPLRLRQEDIQINGHALEVRLYAEDARNGFVPATGNVLRWVQPEVPGLRYDSGIAEGSKVDVFYDPMVAKVIAHAATRTEVTARLYNALAGLFVPGFVSNRHFLAQLIASADFVNNRFDTRYIEREGQPLIDSLTPDAALLVDYATAITLYRWQQRQQNRTALKHLPSGWRNLHFSPQTETLSAEGNDYTVKYRYLDQLRFVVEIGGEKREWQIESSPTEGHIALSCDGHRQSYLLATAGNAVWIQTHGSPDLCFTVVDRFPEAIVQRVAGDCIAPMPGQVARVLVAAGDTVEDGTPLLVINSMKTENTIAADKAGVIKEIFVEVGQFVEANTLVAVIM